MEDQGVLTWFYEVCCNLIPTECSRPCNQEWLGIFGVHHLPNNMLSVTSSIRTVKNLPGHTDAVPKHCYKVRRYMGHSGVGICEEDLDIML